MTTVAKRQHKYLIEASGRDPDGTSFQFFDGAQGWGSAAQALSAMFRRAPGEAEITVLECDLRAGRVKDVTVEMLAAAEKAFHDGVSYDAARTGAKRQRRTVSSYGSAT